MLTASVVAPVVDWSRRVSRSLGTGGAFDNVARRVEEQRVAREQIDLLARRLATGARALRPRVAA